ncbi:MULTISPECIES: MarR family winged helix-turn-helix transcriptional regulator [Rhizobium/Agrobacterium group]|jgi:DNA-binding MarR family transcriptional regulator|uniref:MarR family winged helix-turn-helix transcriptional regulator n=1 Tax=Rhizobium/Agrobacterium group TaxID=227290 RepID=UPI00083E0895|nr:MULTISPECIES: MarR family transcriptional regulator [unclassified Agrobacterium]AOG10180.1 winged helix DNA-binding domain protein [Agrobacterium sp. RAC06]QGG91744.1 MarR family transcriptional regulator [Agrobacterium sp. MA01]
MSESAMPDYFRLFNEIGIIGQLSRSLLEARLPPGFVAAQFYVLNHLVRVGDGRTPLAIASAFQVPKTSMTHSLAVLEQAGLIEIRKNPGDGRSKLVHITDAGRKFRQDAIDALAPDLKRIAAAVPPDHVARLLPDLEVLRKFLDTDRDASP